MPLCPYIAALHSYILFLLSASLYSFHHTSFLPYLYDRLYSKGRILGYKRGKSLQQENTTLLKLDNVNTIQDAQYYLGKRVAFVYHGKKARAVSGKGTTFKAEDTKKSRTRAIWGKIVRTHGNSGVVKAKFRTNLPPKSFGAAVRVMMYPSNI
jgi:large subunit ribosomal protein L35Ae